MSDIEKKQDEKKKDHLTEQVTDQKTDKQGNKIGGFEGQQVSWDSTRKKQIEEAGEDDED